MRSAALIATLLLAWPLAGQVQGPSASGESDRGMPDAATGSATAATAAETMARVPGGTFLPAFATVAEDGSVTPVTVESFALDRTPVTVADFVAFLEAHPGWRRDRVPEVLAGPRYLESWRGPTDPAVDGADRRRPVTGVSWFAARAYCDARGARLPTTDEWEYAAGLGGRGADGSLTADFVRELRTVYAARPAPDALPPVGRTWRNGPGLWDLHGLVWEWTSDFNGLMATGSGRDDQGLDRQLFCAAGSVDATDRSDYAAFARYSFRTGLTGDYAGRMLGFRCARTVR